MPPPGPVIEIGDGRITLEEELVGSTRTIDELGRLTKVDALFDQLRTRREGWKATNPGAPFPGIASIIAAPSTTAASLLSVFQTAAYAGYPNVSIRIGDAFVPFEAQIPGPPCDASSGTCPEQEGYRAHVGLGEDGYRLLVPRENDRIDRRGAAPSNLTQDLESIGGEVPIIAIVAHVPLALPFERFSSLLRAVGEARTIASAPRVLLSVQPFEAVPENAGSTSGGTSVAGRLAPEEIQRVVRSNFDAFRHCYENALKRDPKASGRVTLRFVIDTDGTVREVAFETERSLPDEVGSCVADALRTLTFPPPTGGSVSVSYPIVFTPGG